MARIVFELDAVRAENDRFIDRTTRVVELKDESRSGGNTRKIRREVTFDHTGRATGRDEKGSAAIFEIRSVAIDLNRGTDIGCGDAGDLSGLLEEEVATETGRNSADIEISKLGGRIKKSNAEERASWKSDPGDGGLGSAGVDLKFSGADGEEETGKIKGELGDAQASGESGIGKLEVTGGIGDRGERAAIGSNIEARVAEGKRGETSVGLLDEEIGGEGLPSDIDGDLSGFKCEARSGANLQRFLNSVDGHRFIHRSGSGVDLEIEVCRNGDIRRIDRNPAAHCRGKACRSDGNDALTIDELERTIAEVRFDLARGGNDITTRILLEEEVSGDRLIENAQLHSNSRDTNEWPCRNAHSTGDIADAEALCDFVSSGINLQAIRAARSDRADSEEQITGSLQGETVIEEEEVAIEIGKSE